MSRIGKKSPSICMFKDKTNLNFISQSILFRFLLNFLLPVVTFEMRIPLTGLTTDIIVPVPR
jgi:hypothetical protein